MRNLVILPLLILVVFFSCSKYEMDSIYHPNLVNAPVVRMDKNVVVQNDALIFSGRIDKSGPSRLLRYGHLWGYSPDLKFAGDQYYNNHEVQFTGIQADPILFNTFATDFDKDRRLYFATYAVNEAGIAYSVVQTICSDVYFERYSIVQEENNDNKINPGETVTLRLFFKNRSPIKSISPMITSISKLSEFIISVNPLNNISLSSNAITQSTEPYADVQFTIASNATGFIQIQVFIIDACSSAEKEIKDSNGNNIRLNIN